ncbi:MAG: 4Fe-4S dicluster domain-containing protein [Bacteroidales bacterium]|nr:4Fe-4S dicluster domain-containing protein [Bacteroidales bacterium]HNW72318.1 4Fe-4S dicluster domain-containing protein [Bacteroidales bacterium]HPS49577.1 4Fe-4S dicluster domain-containing protein [Bacteroidales bacterium]
MDYTNQIREIASKLFAEGKIDVFVGYRMTGFDENQVPALIRDPNEVSKLVFTDKSVFNLTNYLKQDHTRNKRIGMVVKGCDSRALNLLLTESQVKRENLHIVGIPCKGVVDENGNKMQNCIECIFPNPVVFDEMVDGTPTGSEAPPYQVNTDIQNIAAMDLVERRAYFEEVFESCIRCNACRHSCPMCYCAKCCIDQETSTLYHGANTTSSAFHALMTWSLHLAGRCVDCRNCEKACPSHLPLHLLHKWNEQVIYENFQEHLAGVHEGDRGAFYKYSMKDPDDFIM